MVSAVTDRELELLLRKLNADRGLDAHHYRQSYIERRIAARLRAVQLDSYREYRRFLDENIEEYNHLVSALTINVTEFFRDRAVFDLFSKQVVPALLRKKAERHQRLTRVWSAGCAGGEEPYSIAMILADAVKRFDSGFHVSVHATDIDDESLEAASNAVYPNKELRSIPAHFRSECISLGEGRFSISSDIRGLVKFRRLDLFADKPIAAVDVIFCRNVLIYFDRVQQERVFTSFHAALNRGGYLIIGKSEKIGGQSAHRFESLSSREKVYQRRD